MITDHSLLYELETNFTCTPMIIVVNNHNIKKLNKSKKS